jgi:hypothetical protein
MTLRKQEDTGSWRRKLKIALFGELSLEEAIDLSRDRQILEWLVSYSDTTSLSSGDVLGNHPQMICDHFLQHPSYFPLLIIVNFWSGEVNCCWSSPAQSFLVPSPAGLMTIFYSLTTLGDVQLHFLISFDSTGLCNKWGLNSNVK